MSSRRKKIPHEIPYEIPYGIPYESEVSIFSRIDLPSFDNKKNFSSLTLIPRKIYYDDIDIKNNHRY